MHLKNNSDMVYAVEQLVDALVLPSFIVGIDNFVTYSNAAADVFLLGDKHQTLTGRDIHTLVAHSQSTDFLKRLHSRQLVDPTVTLMSARSDIHSSTVSALRNELGAVVGYLMQCATSEPSSLPSPSGPQTTELSENAQPCQRSAPKIEDKPETDSNIAEWIESEWRLKTALHSANHAVWDHDFEKKSHFVSEMWREMRGLSAIDPIPQCNKAWLKTIHPKDQENIQDNLKRLDANETDVINYKFRQKHTAGHWIWILSSGRVVRRDKNDRPARIIGTDTEITDIKTVELERHRMAERLDTAMEAAEMGRWEFDVGANYAYWDDRLLEIFSISDGANFRDANSWGNYIHPDDKEKTLALAAECLAHGNDISCDFRHLRSDGTVRQIRTRGKYVQDAELGPRYYGVNFDVTRDYARNDELELARARLEYDSRHDALTGLANRRFLDDTFAKHAAHDRPITDQPAILHFDIDHFKQINDTLGHDAGDATLKHAAEVLKRNVPESALVARVGGDEFVTVLFDTPECAALEDLAKRIISEMSLPFHYGAQQCKIGTSIGIAVAEKFGTLDRELLTDADLALYAAKKAGRGQFCFFSSEMKTEAQKRKNSFDALLAGFDNGEITCHCQPQFDAKTLQLTGLEALVRWESNAFGLIMPDEFLSTAEDMGLVAHFDELVLRRTLFDLDQWASQGHNIPRVSVNVSSTRLNDPNLIERLKPLDIPKGKISFELLESAFLDSHNATISRNLRQIEQMGIEVEIDDFGSGHASIVSLLQVAPKRLKIDRTLIELIVRSRRQRDLIKTIIGIGKMLDVKVVAEGVETWEHVRVLQDIGCCHLQGYGLARPMNAKALGAFMQKLEFTDGYLASGH